ncbi:MAG: glucosyl-3-phosphoglycerate synthase, partial [Treponema sp.]|nr:glucosyl-3-phosphoglycerate synthase [Treponema sp.]
HHSKFSDVGALVALKEKKNVKISLAFPTLNEEATIGKEILIMRTELMDRYPLLDEIAIIDSSSKDNTRKVAEQFGAKVFTSRTILPKCGSFKGKGENLWKSLYVLEGDIVVWVDADISNISPKFVYGLLGPLLEDDRISYVKAFYERPIRSSKGITSSGGGRVTEILVRPLFSQFFPELARFIQPLSGEYAGRRSLLERLPFSVGYGVELGHLIDILEMDGIEALAQVDLDMRIHRNQTTEALGRMSFGILHTFFERVQKYGKSGPISDLGEYHISLERSDAEHNVVKTEISTVERPPIITVNEYRTRFKK